MMMQIPEAVTSVLDSGIEYIYSMKMYVEPTCILVPDLVRAQVAALSEAIGFDVETLTYTLALFLCYPLAMIMNTLPYGPIRHFFSFFLGAFLLQFTLGVQWIHQLITSLIAYALLAILPRKTAATVVPAFVVLYCVLGHLHRQYVNYLGWELDFTGTQMVLTQKLYMLAFNLYDGEVLAKGKDSRAAKKCQEFALKDLPNILEYLGYTFCFSTLLCGPAFEFVTYRNACDGAHIFKPDGKPRGASGVPSNVMPTLKPFLLSIICMAAFVVLGGIFPLFDTVDPQKNLPAVLKEDFLPKPFYYRYAYMWIALFAIRQKYYFAWKNAEGANNLWYMGFEGYDDQGKEKGWDNACNVQIFEFETAPNLQTLSREWNKKTSQWLTRYVYIRTNGSLIAVYSLSAFWHGFYPGYYMFFLSVPLLTICERLGRKKISPYFSNAKWSLYGIVCIVTTSLPVEYMISSFQLLALDRSWACWKSFFFFGHIASIIFYGIVSNLPTPRPKEKTV